MVWILVFGPDPEASARLWMLVAAVWSSSAAGEAVVFPSSASSGGRETTEARPERNSLLIYLLIFITTYGRYVKRYAMCSVFLALFALLPVLIKFVVRSYCLSRFMFFGKAAELTQSPA